MRSIVRPKFMIPVLGAALLSVVGGLMTVATPATAATPVVHVGASLRMSGLHAPVQVTSANDGSSRLFIVERAGLIRIFGGTPKTSYLNISSKVNTNGSERGMLGVAFDPAFATTHRFWVSYVRADGNMVISRFQAASASAPYTLASTEKVVLTVTRPDKNQAFHNGGSLAFGKDGYLYIGVGDGGGAGDPYRKAQKRDVFNGKILRIDVKNSCSGKNYCIPRTNPYASRSSSYRPEIYAYGLRNPWRFSFDAANGTMWMGDVGQDRWEEINTIKPGVGGINFGWSCREGTDAFVGGDACVSGANLVSPTIKYCHTAVSGCPADKSGVAVIGGYVYRGRYFQNAIGGVYVFGDFTGNVWAGSSVTKVGSIPQITSFGEDDNRELWAVDLRGHLYAISATKS